MVTDASVRVGARPFHSDGCGDHTGKGTLNRMIASRFRRPLTAVVR
jgi:hypothetical protein